VLVLSTSYDGTAEPLREPLPLREQAVRAALLTLLSGSCADAAAATYFAAARCGRSSQTESCMLQPLALRCASVAVPKRLCHRRSLAAAGDPAAELMDASLLELFAVRCVATALMRPRQRERLQRRVMGIDSETGSRLLQPLTLRCALAAMLNN